MKRGRKQALTVALAIWVILLIAAFYYLFNVYSELTSDIPIVEVYSHQKVNLDGSTREMQIGDIVSAEVAEDSYSFKLIDATNREAEFVVNDYLYFGIGTGEEKKLDLNNDGVYDVAVRVSSVSDRRVSLSFSQDNTRKSLSSGVSSSLDRFNENTALQTNLLILVALIVLLVFLFIVIKVYIMPKVEEKKKQARKSELETFEDFYEKFQEYQSKGNMTKAKLIYKKISHLYRYMTESDKKKVQSKVDKMIKYLK